MTEHARFSRRQVIAISAASALPLLTGELAAQDTAQPLRLAGPSGGLQTLDPALTRDLAGLFLVRQVYRGLLRFDADLQPVPDLAEGVETSSDLRTYTFRIRPNAAFADGTIITSAHVAASYRRALDPATAGGAASGLAAVTYLGDIAGASEMLAGSASQLSGLQMIDDRTISITLTGPGATFLTRLASVPTSIVDAGEAIADPQTWWQHPNATGPFAIDSLDDEMLVLVPNPAYIGMQPAIGRVEVVLGPNSAQPLNLFQAGEIDLVTAPASQSASLLEDPASSIEAEVARTPLFATDYIALGNTQPPLDDVHIRRALRFLISPDLVARAMFDGTVTAATGLIPEGMLGRSWPSAHIGADPELARREIGLSRYGTAERVPPIAIYAADIEPIEALRDLAAEALGLMIEAVAVGWSDFLGGLAARRFPAYGLYWGADYPDPEAFLGMLFRADGSENYTGYVNEAFDAILNQARSVADDDTRAGLYAEAQDILLEDAGVIPLYFDVGVTVSRPGLTGLDVTPLGILGLESVTSLP
jgi:ABC-type transport system substrate-binding protein